MLGSHGCGLCAKVVIPWGSESRLHDEDSNKACVSGNVIN